jgi:hypothetical protein
MIKHEFLSTEGILLLEPAAPLEKSDFDRLSDIVDPYIQENGRLNGLVIHAVSFPGWQDFSTMLAHIKFIRDHHARISKVAMVADEGVLAVLPAIADRLVKADVRHFEHDDLDNALEWIRQD